MDQLLQHYYTWMDFLLAALTLLRRVCVSPAHQGAGTENQAGGRLPGRRVQRHFALPAALPAAHRPGAGPDLPVHQSADPRHPCCWCWPWRAFSRIRDYLSGRIILFNPLIGVGKRMRTDKSTGVISKISRIGLYLQTGEGLHFVNYTTLLTEGVFPHHRQQHRRVLSAAARFARQRSQRPAPAGRPPHDHPLPRPELQARARLLGKGTRPDSGPPFGPGKKNTSPNCWPCSTSGASPLPSPKR